MPGLDLWHKNAVIYSLDVETLMDCSCRRLGRAGSPS